MRSFSERRRSSFEPQLMQTRAATAPVVAAFLKSEIMKSLKNLSDTEKAKLLVSLFPSQRKPIVEAIEARCAYIRKHEAEIRQRWNDPYVTVNIWLFCVYEVQELISNIRFDLYHNSTCFATQLFYDHRATFCAECISLYAKELQTGTSFKLSVALLLCAPKEFDFSFNNTDHAVN